MFFEQYAGELIAFISGVVGVVLGKITTRKREKVDIKGLEVRITDKLLKIIMTDIVEPLRDELDITREELKTFKNAFRKKHTCRNNADCPIVSELQKQQANNNSRTYHRKQVTNRQREPVDEADDEAGDGSGIDGPDETAAGWFKQLTGWCKFSG